MNIGWVWYNVAAPCLGPPSGGVREATLSNPFGQWISLETLTIFVGFNSVLTHGKADAHIRLTTQETNPRQLLFIPVDRYADPVGPQDVNWRHIFVSPWAMGPSDTFKLEIYGANWDWKPGHQQQLHVMLSAEGTVLGP